MNFSDLVSIPIAPTIERKLVLTSLAGAPLPRPVFNFKQRLLESAQA